MIGFVDDYSQTPLAGPWTSHNVVKSFHVYDMAARTGSELWMVGSFGDNAVAWRSPDGGVPWSIALTVPPRNSGVGDFARFYFAGAYQNALYVQAADYDGGKHPTSKVFDGTGGGPMDRISFHKGAMATTPSCSTASWSISPPSRLRAACSPSMEPR